MTKKRIENLVKQGKLYEHHSAWHNGYVSRKGDACVIKEYIGHFGKGYKVLYPAFNSTRYCICTYYIFKEV